MEADGTFMRESMFYVDGLVLLFKELEERQPAPR